MKHELQRQAGAHEIEITPEMIEAGGWVLFGNYDPATDSPYQAAEMVIRTALQAACYRRRS
jgi:hypothetical protein